MPFPAGLPSLLRNQVVVWWEFPCHVGGGFSPCWFFIFSVFKVCQFDYCVSLRVPPWVYPTWDSASWVWLTIYFSILGKFSAIVSWNISSGPFSLLRGLCNGKLVCLILAHRSLRLSSFLCSLFSSRILFCGSDLPWPLLSPLLLITASVFVCLY